MVDLHEEAFSRDIASEAFEDGRLRGKWGLFEDLNRPEGAVPIAWPNAVIWISAVPRDKSPDRYYFWFTLDGYPKLAPTSYCWCPDTRGCLPDAKWPSSRDPEELTFRQNWPGGGKRALYAPWDRMGRIDGGHAEWVPLKGLIWDPERHTIVDYLRHTHRLLNAPDYRGTYEAANP